MKRITLRVEDDLWAKLQIIALERKLAKEPMNYTLQDVCVEFLEDGVAEERPRSQFEGPSD